MFRAAKNDILLSYQVAFKRYVRWLHRRLLSVVVTSPSSSPPCRLPIILNATCIRQIKSVSDSRNN